MPLDTEVEDQILPNQFFAIQEFAPPGEQMIRFRVLRDAIREFQKFAFSHTKRGIKIFDEVYTWITTNDAAWPYSFVNLCEVFNIDAEAARGALVLWKKKEGERRDAEETQADTSPRPEPGPELQAEGGSNEIA